ncbi:MAG: MCP four helix bundle domain-containing protein [Deltaproteobacteria bacterium]|nr:MAG: MCP four helix bundle domain-containing protein [Deltaproteobacteria bacterium]
MMKRLSLRSRIILILAALVLTTLGGGLISMWHTYRMGHVFTSVIDTAVTGLQAAEELETALVRQKGLTTYYFLDGNPDWLGQVEQLNESFNTWLRKARDSAQTANERGILNQIESEYLRYIFARDQVVQLYQAGKREAGAQRHWAVRKQFFAIQALCDQYREIHKGQIKDAWKKSRAQTRLIKGMTLVALPSVLVLGLLLAYILLNQILKPIRILSMEAGDVDIESPLPIEMTALRQRVHSLMEDVDQTQSELQQSRAHLLQAEKLAMVGKLAAGVAHTIRNPLTSVNMRLFSLERSLELSQTQQEDFEVIAEEVRHIDNIVQNFLEFARPPKLKIQSISPSEVVDMALQLLRHRLESYGVQVELDRQNHLPQIEGDPEQLKEVLVNLLVNSCEAMGEGGLIVIREEEGVAEPLGRVVVIRVKDNGPGIPKSVRDKVFQPFYSTKEEGTGLGLSIAYRIVEEHGGWLSLKSKEGEGTTFTITLPCREDAAWARS